MDHLEPDNPDRLPCFFSEKDTLESRRGYKWCEFAHSMLISYPVHINLYYGQVEVFLVICVGEFIRSAVNKKPILSGIWLGGLLLNHKCLS